MNKDMLQDPFLQGNEQIEEAIETFRKEGTKETLISVLESIRNRMHDDGHFIIPVERDADDSNVFKLRAIQTENGKLWQAAFTSQTEFEKGAPSEVLSNYIDITMQDCVGSANGAEGFIINPWGQSFMLTKDLMRMIFEADGGVEYIVPDAPVTADLLEDGTYLKRAMEICDRNRTRWNMFRLFKILRDSLVWIPCNAIPDEDIEAQLAEMLNDAGDDPDSIIGKTFKSAGQLRMVPDILQSGEDYFFPVFTTEEEMGEYGTHFSKLQRHFLEAIAMARANEKDVAGIVINAYSGAFVINKEAFDLIEGMESSLEGQEPG